MRDTKNEIRILKWIVIGFVILCGVLVIESGLFKNSSQLDQYPILLQQTTTDETPETINLTEAENAGASVNNQLQADSALSFGADDAPAQTIIIGAADPNTEDPKTGYKFQLELSSKGAAIRKAIFSNGKDNGFDNRDPNNPLPLEIISPALDRSGREILAMANREFEFMFADRRKLLSLQNLNWQSFGVGTSPDYSDSQSARFEAIIKNAGNNQEVLKLTKTYIVRPESYLLDCNITVENLSASEHKVQFNLAGPGGLAREGFRTDMRKVIGGFIDQKGHDSVRHDKKAIIKLQEKLDKAQRNLAIAKSANMTQKDVDNAEKELEKAKRERQLTKSGANFLWAASVNKYFAFIFVPLPDEGKDYCDWLADKTGRLYNPDGDSKANSGDEMFGVDLKTTPVILAETSQASSSKTYHFQLYIGPKDKSLFDKNDQYRNLGFIQTIDFMGCCCPKGISQILLYNIIRLLLY